MPTVNSSDSLNSPSHSTLHTQAAQKDEANTFTLAQNIGNTGGLQVSGTKVVGAQGAAVADATDAASAITQLNLLLARCRAHGLIAT